MGGRIVTMQRQARELGRLRTGYTDHSGAEPRPVKSRTWIFSSAARHYVEAAAVQFGGQVETWQPLGRNVPEQHRVITESPSIDALLSPGDPLTQANEMWTGGGCARRCDGRIEQLSRRECLCLGEYGQDWYLESPKRVCRPTSRLNVMLPDMPDIGLWRVETHSYWAANEWGGTVDSILSGTGGRGLVPVALRIEQRRRLANGLTKHFPVIAVELRGLTPRQALSGPIPTEVALGPAPGGEPLAIESGDSREVPDYLGMAEQEIDAEGVREVWRTARRAGHVAPDGSDPLSLALQRIAASLTAGPEPDEDGAIDAELVEDPA